MIGFIEKKNVDWSNIIKILELSSSSNQWTNFGPVSLLLEQEIKKCLGLSDSLEVVMCASGTAALHSLVNLSHFLHGRELSWVVSSYGFPCTIQGPLRNAKVVDCRSDGMLDLEKLHEIDFDGLVVTNIFGTCNNLKEYSDYCEKFGKVFLSDSATSFDSSEHLSGEAISFHHTKPWGFGEGGCAIIEKDLVATLRSIVNFGLSCGKETGRWALNAKISDLSSAFILQRLRAIATFGPMYRQQYQRILAIAEQNEISILASQFQGIPCHIPLLFDLPVSTLENSWLKLHKYYRPLDPSPRANNLFERIINFPCHPGISAIEDSIIEILFHKLKVEMLKV